MTITGINIVRNCVENGYPFIEAILSALPICDEYLVNDGGSTDGTLKALQELSETYSKIKIYNMSDEQSIRWDTVSNQINQLIKEAKGRWIFLGNADELLHEDDLLPIQQHIELNPHRILRFDRREIRHDWSNLGEDVYHPARVTVNDHGVHQNWNQYGGDEFLYSDGWYDPNREIKSGYTIYHLYNMFPENRVNKLRNDALWLSPGDIYRVKLYTMMRDSKPFASEVKNVYEGLPALAQGLAKMRKYRVRDELFDEGWLYSVTGYPC